MEIEFSIYLASKTRWVHLQKIISMGMVPRVGEYMKFLNAEMGDYFPWQVTQVTYHESGQIQIMTELLDNVDNRDYSFDTESEFDEYIQSYFDEGWQAPHGISQNPYYRPVK